MIRSLRKRLSFRRRQKLKEALWRRGWRLEMRRVRDLTQRASDGLLGLAALPRLDLGSGMKMNPYPGWRCRVAEDGSVVHEPIPEEEG